MTGTRRKANSPSGSSKVPTPDILLRIATVVLNASVALAAGSLLSGIWLARGHSAWAAARLRATRRLGLAALAAALPASAATLWLEAAIMADAPLAHAGEAVRTVLSGTHYGLAWAIGAGALAAVALLRMVRPWSARAGAAEAAGLLVLGMFFYTRSIVSHAAAEGDLNAAVLVDWSHLVLASLWTGAVAVAALAVMPAGAPLREDELGERAGYVQTLSDFAGVAVAGIVATGLFSAQHNVGGMANAFGNPYATLLWVKIALVLVAATLGGANRFLVMPALLDARAGTAERAQAGATRFTRVLQAETLVLCAVLVLAVLLGSTEPPPPG